MRYTEDALPNAAARLTANVGLLVPRRCLHFEKLGFEAFDLLVAAALWSTLLLGLFSAARSPGCAARICRRILDDMLGEYSRDASRNPG